MKDDELSYLSHFSCDTARQKKKLKKESDTRSGAGHPQRRRCPPRTPQQTGYPQSHGSISLLEGMSTSGTLPFNFFAILTSPFLLAQPWGHVRCHRH
jgi:hypothetical protein